MHIGIDTLTLIEKADLARRLARDQMDGAVDALLAEKGCTIAFALTRFGGVHRTHGRIEAIKEARRVLYSDLLHARCVIDSLADRFGAHFTDPKVHA